MSRRISPRSSAERRCRGYHLRAVERPAAGSDLGDPPERPRCARGGRAHRRVLAGAAHGRGARAQASAKRRVARRGAGPAIRRSGQLDRRRCCGISMSWRPRGGRRVACGARRRSTVCALARAGEFTRRAFENGRIDLTEAEGLADLIEAETESQRKAALALAEGGLAQADRGMAGALLGLSARAERAIDYDEGDERRSGAVSAIARRLAAELEQWLDAAADRAAERRRAGRRRRTAKCREIQPYQCDSWGGAGNRHRHVRAPRAIISKCRWRLAGFRSC